MGFTDLLSRLPSGKAFRPSYCEDEFVIASIDKIQNILSNRDHFNLVSAISVDILSFAVSTNTLVISTIPSEFGNLSQMIKILLTAP